MSGRSCTDVGSRQEMGGASSCHEAERERQLPLSTDTPLVPSGAYRSLACPAAIGDDLTSSHAAHAGCAEGRSEPEGLPSVPPRRLVSMGTVTFLASAVLLSTSGGATAGTCLQQEWTWTKATLGGTGCAGHCGNFQEGPLRFFMGGDYTFANWRYAKGWHGIAVTLSETHNRQWASSGGVGGYITNYQRGAVITKAMVVFGNCGTSPGTFVEAVTPRTTHSGSTVSLHGQYGKTSTGNGTNGLTVRIYSRSARGPWRLAGTTRTYGAVNGGQPATAQFRWSSLPLERTTDFYVRTSGTSRYPASSTPHFTIRVR